MTNTKLLKSAVDNSGVTITFLAKKMNCTRNRIYAIMDGTGSDVTAAEIVALAKYLHLTADQRDEIFLTENVN